MNVVIVFAMLCCEPFATLLAVLHRRKADGGIHRAVLGVTAAPFGQFEEEAPRREWTGVEVEEFAAAGIAVVENLHGAAAGSTCVPSAKTRQQIFIVVRRDRQRDSRQRLCRLSRALRVNRGRQKRRAVARRPDNRQLNEQSAWLGFAKYSAQGGCRPAGCCTARLRTRP